MSQDLCKSGFLCLNDEKKVVYEKFWKIILILFLCGSKMLNKSCCCLNVNINSRDRLASFEKLEHCEVNAGP